MATDLGKDANQSQVAPSVQRVFVAIVCCAWIIGIVAARQVARPNLESGPPTIVDTSPILLAAALAATAIVLSGLLPIGTAFPSPERKRAVAPIGMWRPMARGDSVSCLVFTIGVAGMICNGWITPRDAAACFLAVTGVILAGRTGAMWTGAILMALAGACSPMCLGAMLVLIAAPQPRRRRMACVAFAAVIAIAATLLVHNLGGTEINTSLALWSDVARIGPHEVWRWLSHRIDALIAAVALALMPVAGWMLGDDRCEKPAVAHFEKGLIGWLIVNLALTAYAPRMAVDHVLLIMLPMFPLSAAGWTMVRRLPFDRKDWTLSLFSAAAHALPFLLLARPIVDATSVTLLALFAS